jgi:hypothetical protein
MLLIFELSIKFTQIGGMAKNQFALFLRIGIILEFALFGLSIK